MRTQHHSLLSHVQIPYILKVCFSPCNNYPNNTLHVAHRCHFLSYTFTLHITLSTGWSKAYSRLSITIPLKEVGIMLVFLSVHG